MIFVFIFCTVGCESPTNVKTKYIHDTVEVKPYNHIGTWEADNISYTSGNKGIWRFTLTSSGTFSFSRMDTTDDSKSRYYFGTYSVDGETMDFNITSMKIGKNGTSNSISMHDLCTYSHYDNTSSEYLRITENGPDFMFNTANFLRFDKTF